MKGKIGYLKHFNLWDFLTLSCGLLAGRVYRGIPKRLLVTKKILDYLQRNNGRLSKSKDEVVIDVNATRYALRTNGSDLDVFNQIVLDHGLDRVVELTRQLNISDIHIVDCGANIGLATVVFKTHFPHARIICLEPEPSNYAQLSRNIAFNDGKEIYPSQMGVWYEQATLTPDNTFRDGEHWSFALKSGGNTEGPGIQVNSLNAIVSQHDWNRIDVLKIDIEGSEFPLFRNLDKWKTIWDTVRIVSLEVHEEVGSVFEIAEILWRNGFKLEIHGELIVGFRDRVAAIF